MRIPGNWFVFICFFLIPGLATAQTLGGNSSFSFLRLPLAPLPSALGMSNVSLISKDPTMATMNPSLLQGEMHGLMNLSYNAFISGSRQMNGQVSFAVKPWQTMLAGGIDFIDYGNAAMTDAAGNVMGDFRARDYALRLSASRSYGERWRYGLTLKLAGSAYGMYRSSALLGDVGISYQDTSGLFQAGFTVKNMGLQLKTYAGQGEDLPFDLQVGISKKLRYAPLQFSFTAHRLHRFDILYRDTSFNIDNYGVAGRSGFMENLLRHFVVSVQGYLGDKVEITLGYNHLMRSELGISNAANGLSGFSFGAGVLLKRLQLRFARSAYVNGLGYSQLGIGVALDNHP